VTPDNVQNKKPLFTIKKIIAEYTECNPTSYQIYDATGSPHTILSIDYTTNPDQLIVTCIDPSCVLN
jgi:hypothetical protein